MLWPTLIADDEIEQAEKEKEERLRKYVASLDQQDAELWERQEKFLAAYDLSLSVELGCRAAGVTKETFSKWKRTSPPFMRHLNIIIERWQAELVGSTIGKAVGYFQRDEEQPDGIARDPMGRPIRTGVSEPLARRWLDALLPTTKETEANVSVSIDLGQLGVPGSKIPVDVKITDNNNARVIEHTPINGDNYEEIENEIRDPSEVQGPNES
jgi:hypothetical protein